MQALERPNGATGWAGRTTTRRVAVLAAVMAISSAGLAAHAAAAGGGGPAPAAPSRLAPVETCETCHFDAARLRATADDPAQALKTLVDRAEYARQRHPFQCVVCHKGQSPAPDKTVAHQGLVVTPDAADALPTTCGQEKCHPGLVQTYPTSIHATAEGLHQGALEVFPQEYADWLFTERCSTCHASCADCHLKEPDKTVRVSTHSFARNPSAQVCTSCHDQTGMGFLGYQGYFNPSVHAVAGLTCGDCHVDAEVHGSGTTPVRLKEAVTRSCEDCHRSPGKVVKEIPVPQYKTGADNLAHALHEATLDCSACHVQWNYNCYGCHGYDEKGDPKGYDRFDTDVHLARNPQTGKVSTVVHAPMSLKVGGREFANGAWTFKNRHSIQKRARECQDCHSDLNTFVTGRVRQAPFVVGSVKGDFLPFDELQPLLIAKGPATELAHQLLPPAGGTTAQAAAPSAQPGTTTASVAVTSTTAPPPPATPQYGRPVQEHLAVRVARVAYLILIPAILAVFGTWIASDAVRRRADRRRGGGKGATR